MFFTHSDKAQLLCFFFFFFNDTATTEIYTLSLHDALPISSTSRRTTPRRRSSTWSRTTAPRRPSSTPPTTSDRKSTRLNSSHGYISYAVFCLKKKKKIEDTNTHTTLQTTQPTSTAPPQHRA